MGLPECLFVCHLILLLVCFLFNDMVPRIFALIFPDFFQAPYSGYQETHSRHCNKHKINRNDKAIYLFKKGILNILYI